MGQKKSKPRVTRNDESATNNPSINSLIQMKKFGAAVSLAQQEVQQNKSRLGLEHPRTLRSMFELGQALHGDGRVARALQVFQELLPLNEKLHGRSHPYTLEILDAVCEELCNMGKFEQSLALLIDERQRCEEALGLQHEHTIRVLIDIAHMSNILGKTDETSSVFALALDRSQRSLGENHNVTLAIKNDLRKVKGPSLPDLEKMKALLRQSGLPVPTKPFSNHKSATWRDIVAGKELHIIGSVGYEASNASSLRLGPINGDSLPRPPVHIPTYYVDTSKVNLRTIPSDTKLDSSFSSLIKRSIEILPQGVTTVSKQAMDEHIAFLKSLKSLDELLSAKENPVWFFQHRKSFMEQTTFQKWDPNSLERYIILPMEGGFANSEDCIFISHYWQTEVHPDPDGQDLKKLQELLALGFWSQSKYIWVDWTCLPQRERTASQKQYFARALQSIPRLVRDCSFLAEFSEFRPRLWVLFEVAAFTFNRADAVGLPCTDVFQKHLLQMKGGGIRQVLDMYKYKCTNDGDREWVINSLEILLTLRKAVPSIHTRRQILNAIDNSSVRACVHQEAGVEIDKERGILKSNGTIYQFNPLPVEDGIPSSVSEVRISGDYEMRLEKALRRAGESFDDAGLGEMAREYDRAGDYKIAEVLHQRYVATQTNPATSQDLCTNLENQEQYEKAAAEYRRIITQTDASDEFHQKVVALEQKQAQLNRYRKWKSQPLGDTIQMGGDPHSTTTNTRTVPPLAIRNGLRRSWLQRLDQSVWQCDDPVVMKSMDERCLDLEEHGHFSEAQAIRYVLLERRKELLGPCHIDTRQSLSDLARTYKLAGNTQDAHMLYVIANAVCDFTLGPWHPESRATLGDLAAIVLLRGKPGVARGYYRQLLERMLAVAEWDDPETFVPKFFLKALVGEGQLRIVQADEATTVQILGYLPQDTEHPNSNPALTLAENDPASTTLQNENESNTREEGHGKSVMLLDLEHATDFLFRRYIIAN